ncbi:MAG: chorismate lyase [Rhodoferax sp.]
MTAPHFSTLAHWHTALPRTALSMELREWLINRDSLTQRLVARCGSFKVECLHQHASACLADERDALGLPRRTQVMEREVLLRCDNVAVVYAHTVLPLTATAQQWPLFASLGNRSLGTTLFQDPQVQRGALQFARLRANHPLMRRIRRLQLPQTEASTLFARRSRFTRHGSSLLVTEVFLPTLFAQLRPLPER